MQTCDIFPVPHIHRKVVKINAGIFASGEYSSENTFYISEIFITEIYFRHSSLQMAKAIVIQVLSLL